MGCFLPMEAGWEMEGQRPKTMAWMGEVAESQETESSLENHLAKRWVEARNHSMKPKTKRVYEQGAAGWKDKEVVWNESRDKLGMLVETLYLIPTPA